MSGEDPRADREGIYIDRELADEIAIDEELDAGVEGEFSFPSPERRRVAGWLYLVAAGISLVAIPSGWMVAGGLVLLAGWNFASAWPLRVDEKDAMTIAAAVVDFPVGHSSAAVRFLGWRSRPRWSVVMYSASEPPDRRALVVVDAVTGEIVETPYTDELAQP